MAAPDAYIPSPSTRLMVPGFILFVLVSVGSVRGPSLMTSDGIGSAVIVVAPLVLATYALTIIVMAGRAGVDLSIGPLIGFINVGMIKLVEAGIIQSPIAVFLYAMGVGVAYQLLMGLIIVYVRVQPIIVSLSGYLALVGLNLLILPRPSGVAPDWMNSWGSGTSIFSPVLAIVVIATLGWYAIARSAFFGHLRLMGSDERAAYTSGVKINIVRLGAHCIAGIYAGLASICFTSLISSGDPTQGTTYTLMAVTALVLGGASLSGGRGGATGSLLGALNIYLITYLLATFSFGNVQSYVTDLSYGTMLVGSLLINSALPQIQRAARYLSPALFFAVLASIGAGVILHATVDGGAKLVPAGTTAPVAAAATVVDAVVPQVGTGILLVLLGLAGLAYLISLLVRFPRGPMVSLTVVVVIVALGLIFHHVAVGDGVPVMAHVAQHLSGLALDSFALDGNASVVNATTASTPLTGLVIAVVLSLGVVTLGSVIITLNLFDAHAINPAAFRVVILAAIGLAALVLVTLVWTGGADTGGIFGRQGVILVVAGAILFVLMWSPIQARLQNIANVYIVVLAVIALGSLYFSATSPGTTDTPLAGGVPLRTYMVASPAALPTIETVPVAAAAPLPEPSTGGSPIFEVSYSITVMLALQFSLWLAMRGPSGLKNAVSYGYTIVGAVLAWSGLFYFAHVSLTVIIVTIAAAIVTAPLVWLAFASYAKSFDDPDSLVVKASDGPAQKREVRA